MLLDLLTIKFMSGYLTRPMHFMGGLGLLFFFFAFVSLGTTVVMKTISNQWMTGNPLLYLSVGLGLVGTQMLSMGLLGEVMMRTYYESQDKRPYVVRESCNTLNEVDEREPRALEHAETPNRRFRLKVCTGKGHLAFCAGPDS